MFGLQDFIACSGNGHIISSEIREEINQVKKGGNTKAGYTLPTALNLMIGVL
jgi:hypothetical protein